jgi:hypothetical protein
VKGAVFSGQFDPLLPGTEITAQPVISKSNSKDCVGIPSSIIADHANVAAGDTTTAPIDSNRNVNGPKKIPDSGRKLFYLGLDCCPSQ